MRLWVRLALVMAALAVVPVLFVGGSAIQVATLGAEEISEARLQREATVQAELLGRWIHDQARSLLTWPQQFGDRLHSFRPEAQIGFSRMVYKGMPSALTVVLLDGRGRLVTDPVHSARRTGDGSSGADRARDLIPRLPLDAAITQADVVHMGDPWISADGSSGPSSLPLAVLAAGGDDPSMQRILGVEIALEVGEDLLGQVTDVHAVAVVDGEGRPLLGGAHPLIHLDRLRPLLGTGELIDFQDRDGQVHGTVSPVPGTPWSLVVAESAQAVLRPAVEIRSRMVPSVLLSAVGALGLALVMASSVSRPVERLRGAALEVAEGALGTLTEVNRSDEIGDLARAFDHMSSRLQDHQREIDGQRDEIEAFNQDLQDRVEARTRELAEAQDQLVRSGQLAAVAELGAGLAHDLNNPLTGVLGIAQVLRGRSPDDALLADLEGQARRCRDVVAAMLKVSTLEVDPNQAPVVDLHVVLQQVVDLVGGAFRQRGVGLQFVRDHHPELPVRVDPSHCIRLFTQVLAGIRAGLDSGATVQVSASRQGDQVVIRMEADQRIADHRDRRDDWMASGHSLWVARQLVDRVGGRLDELEGGTSWHMLLPGA